MQCPNRCPSAPHRESRPAQLPGAHVEHSRLEIEEAPNAHGQARRSTSRPTVAARLQGDWLLRAAAANVAVAAVSHHDAPARCGQESSRQPHRSNIRAGSRAEQPARHAPADRTTTEFGSGSYTDRLRGTYLPNYERSAFRPVCHWCRTGLAVVHWTVDTEDPESPEFVPIQRRVARIARYFAHVSIRTVSSPI